MVESLDSTLIGVVSGAVGRLIPEIVKISDKVIDNKHELQLLAGSRIVEDNAVNDKVHVDTKSIDLSAIDKIIQITNTPTGNKKIDIITMLVRPHTTYALLWTYITLKFWWYYNNQFATLQEVWTPDDMMLLGGILGFWFLGRVFDKNTK